MKITINVPARLARDVIEQAHSGYWLGNYHYRLRADGNGLYIGKPVKGGEADGDTRIPVPRAFIGAAAIAEGLRIMLQTADDSRAAQCAARVLSGNGSGLDADWVLQYAAYGSLHWG